ncbi:PIG-L deacetylase family protein [Paenibacillus sp. GCM10027628]|uniref:PIG-L deacetylase family protein n=1 Tax=Paenibacillus sp. GCM10027628 TaxID=3273413 RepID=UPI003636264B
MGRIMVIAPHPDDETLGCGGTLLKHRNKGDSVAWAIVTSINENLGYDSGFIQRRKEEISLVSASYGFEKIYELGLPSAHLDTIPLSDIVQKMGECIRDFQPDTIYLPYCGDVHSDHNYVFNAACACAKWFRYPSVQRVLVYETLSETEFGLNPDRNAFRPQVFVNIEPFLDEKIEIMRNYKSEVAPFPFPRSDEAIRALASFRGISIGSVAAESFMLLKEVL